MFYNDEHALTLGVRQVAVKTSSGTTTTDYPVTPLATNPGSADRPAARHHDAERRAERARRLVPPDVAGAVHHGYQQQPGRARGRLADGRAAVRPNAIFGSWKAAVRTVDMTKNPRRHDHHARRGSREEQLEPRAAAIPCRPDWRTRAIGAEARWNVTLTPGHSYRLQVLVHDGDQNKAGGDSGEACVLFCAGGGGCGSDGCPTTGTGGTGGNQCPEAVTICGPGGIPPASCPAGTLCANGCCLSSDG